MDLLSQAFTTFGAGVLASLSPCVYPMIPISLGLLGTKASSKRKRLVLVFFVGQVLTFTLLGFAAVQIGEILGFSSQNRWINISVGIFLLILGLASYVDRIPQFLNRFNQLTNKFKVSGNHRMLNAFLIGVGSSLVASPCTSPILGSVLVEISQQETSASGVVLMVSYAFGMSVIFLGLGLGLMKMKELPRAGAWLNRVHQFTTVLIFFAAGFYFYRAFFF